MFHQEMLNYVLSPFYYYQVRGSLPSSPSCSSAVETLQWDDPGLYLPSECHLVLSKVPRLDCTLSSVPKKKILKAGGPLPFATMTKEAKCPLLCG